PSLSAAARDHANAITLALISRGTAEANLEKMKGSPLATVLLQRDREVADAYGVFGTPSAIVIHPDGLVATALAQGDGAVKELVSRTAESSTATASPASTPDAVWEDLDGRRVTLAQFRGAPVVLLFWDPSCVFCRQALPHLQSFDRQPIADRFALLVV